MNKNKFYIIIIVGLLLSNLALIFFMKTPKRSDGDRQIGPKVIIIERLNFDENQKAAYLELVEEHIKYSRNLRQEIRGVKNQLFSQLNKTENGDLKDSLINEISKKTKAIEKGNYNHFLDIKKLCNESQINDFEELTKDLTKLFDRKPPKGRGKRRK